jgi:hypothetical protein
VKYQDLPAGAKFVPLVNGQPQDAARHLYEKVSDTAMNEGEGRCRRLNGFGDGYPADTVFRLDGNVQRVE